MAEPALPGNARGGLLARASGYLAHPLYAVEDTHGPVVGFLANRSDLPALVFGVFTLLAHDRWRRAGWRAGAFIAPAMLLVSLLFKEAGIATCGYIAAYEHHQRIAGVDPQHAPPNGSRGRSTSQVAVAIIPGLVSCEQEIPS
ncbi:MAG: hypothetical protein AMXMBFR13_26950 [Phycisphaerae bacterium]